MSSDRSPRPSQQSEERPASPHFKLVTPPKASDRSGIPYDTMLRLIHEGALPTVKLPGRRGYFIDLNDLDALIERSKIVGTKVGTKVVPERPRTTANLAPKSGARLAKSPMNIAERPWYERYT